MVRRKGFMPKVILSIVMQIVDNCGVVGTAPNDLSGTCACLRVGR